MTSKEALGILYSKADTTNECWECRQIIEKDLDLLEILLASLLKKLITNGTDSNKTILLDSQSYDKIKELLENDK